MRSDIAFELRLPVPGGGRRRAMPGGRGPPSPALPPGWPQRRAGRHRVGRFNMTPNLSPSAVELELELEVGSEAE